MANPQLKKLCKNVRIARTSKVLKMQKNGVKICIYGKKVLTLQAEMKKYRKQ